jgi:hypothetical protein
MKEITPVTGSPVETYIAEIQGANEGRRVTGGLKATLAAMIAAETAPLPKCEAIIKAMKSREYANAYAQGERLQDADLARELVKKAKSAIKYCATVMGHAASTLPIYEGKTVKFATTKGDAIETTIEVKKKAVIATTADKFYELYPLLQGQTHQGVAYHEFIEIQCAEIVKVAIEAARKPAQAAVTTQYNEFAATVAQFVASGMKATLAADILAKSAPEGMLDMWLSRQAQA